MNDKKRFSKRRRLLAVRGLCQRCGTEKAMPGKTYGILCATEIRTKKIVAPKRIYVCEKIARLERNLAFCHEAENAISSELAKLRAG